MPTLKAFCLPWHVVRSPAFVDMLVEPLRAFAKIELTAWEPGTPVDFDQPLVFCQIPPPPEILAEPRAKIIWLPMWDDARHYSPRWWATLPPGRVRIAAYAAPVHREAVRAGLPTLRVNFYKDPAERPAARWDRGRTLFYWNRTGLADRNFLARLCSELSLDRLIFGSATDPGSEQHAYTLPALLGSTKVTTFGAFLPRADYEALLSEANLYFAPRLYEGVGMTVLEAMGSGCAVLAHDTPTMNEYIAHRHNGWLFPSIRPPLWRERLQSGLHRRFPRVIPAAHPASTLPLDQEWSALRRTDWAQLGQQARRDQATGHQIWLGQLPALARFILDW